jgi:Skp family chaperone for outer membrane proteins
MYAVFYNKLLQVCSQTVKHARKVILMKRSLSALLAVSTLSNIMLTRAETAAEAPAKKEVGAVLSIRVATVDFGKISQELDLVKDKQQEIGNEVERRSKQIQKMQEDSRKKKAELQSMGSVVDATVREQKAKEIMNLDSQIEIEQRAGQKYLEDSQQGAQMAIMQEVYEAVEAYRKVNGIDIVFGGGIIASSGKVDISDEIIKALNDKTRKAKAATKAAVEKKTAKPSEPTKTPSKL